MLVERLAQVEQGRGQVIGIIGEPGVGKSRLLYELRKRSGPERVRFFGGRCLAHGQTTPYLPVIDLVREIFGLDQELDYKTASARLDAESHFAARNSCLARSKRSF